MNDCRFYSGRAARGVVTLPVMRSIRALGIPQWAAASRFRVIRCSMCPACKKPMLILELDGVEVDHCPTCLGTWLDAGELEALLSSDENGAIASLTSAMQTAERLGKSRERQCPRCRRKLEARRVRDAKVTIDTCPRGDGLWLDHGELAALVRAFASTDGGSTGFLGTLFERELQDRAEGDNA